MGKRVLFVAFVAIAALSGCAQIPAGRFESFHTATSNILSNATDTYTRIEKLQGEELLIRVYSKQPLDATSFSAVHGNESFAIGPQLQKREDALTVIEKYAAALSSLAGQNADAIDKASQDLGGAVKSLEKSVGGSNASAAALSTVVDEIARALTDRMRKNALKEVISKAEDPIEKIVEQFGSDQKDISDFVESSRIRVLAFANSARPKFGTLERYEFDQKIGSLLLEIEAILKALGANAVATKAIPAAHKDLAAGLDNEKLNLQSLRNLVSEGQRVKQFYRDASK
jgi:hypothetical protein